MVLVGVQNKYVAERLREVCHEHTSGGCWNTWSSFEAHLKLKLCEISFALNLLLSDGIVLQFCTEHGSITVVLRANFQNDLTNDKDVLYE